MAGNGRFSNTWGILALIVGATISSAVAQKVSAAYHSRDSIVDCLESWGKSSDFEARTLLAKEEVKRHPDKVSMMLPYHGWADQNRHLVDDFCPGTGGVSNVARHPKVSEVEEREIIAGLRDTARAHGVDEVKFVGTARCESEFYSRALGDFGHSRGIFQFHNGFRKEVSDKVAYDWRKAAHVAVKDFFTEGWRKHYVKLRDKNGHLVLNSRGEQKYVWDGTYYWKSEAFQWSCYRKLYGRTSARVIPSSTAPAWAISNHSITLASE